METTRGELHVAGEENFAVLVNEPDARRARHVPGHVKGNLDLLAVGGGKMFGPRVGHRHDFWLQQLDLAHREQRVFLDVELLALALHHVAGIAQHARGQRLRGLAHQDERLRLAAKKHGQRAQVVEMAVRDQNKIEHPVGDQRKVRQRLAPDFFGVHPAVHHEAEGPQLDVKTVRADVAGRV